MPFFCAAGGAGRLAGRGIGSFRGFVRSSTWFVQNRRGTTKPNRVRRETHGSIKKSTVPGRTPNHLPLEFVKRACPTPESHSLPEANKD